MERDRDVGGKGDSEGWDSKRGVQRGELKRERGTKTEERGERMRARLEEEEVAHWSPRSHGNLRTEFHSNEDTEHGAGLCSLTEGEFEKQHYLEKPQAEEKAISHSFS